MINRLRLTDDIIEKDLSLIKTYGAFGADCGDQYAKLDVTLIRD